MRIIAKSIGLGRELVEFNPLDDLVARHPAAGLQDILDEGIGQVIGTLPLHQLGKFHPRSRIHDRIVDDQQHAGGYNPHRFSGVIGRDRLPGGGTRGWAVETFRLLKSLSKAIQKRRLGITGWVIHFPLMAHWWQRTLDSQC